MSKNGQTGWTDNESTADWGDSKAPPPPPEPGLYRFEIAEAKPDKVGKENKPGIKMVLLLTEPFGGGEAVNLKVYATHAVTKERWHVIRQLAESCDVALPTRTGSEALKEFCGSLLDSRGGICRMKHGLDQAKLPRAEIAFGSSYLTEAEARAGDGESPDAGPPVKRKGRNAPAAQA